MNEKKSSVVLALVPVMLCFFAMGFVDLVGTATNFVKSDFQLSDSIANLLPSMVFVMFLLFSVPSGLLMNKIGRKQTVLISLVITLVALLIPCFIYSYWTMLASFILLGIGNAVLQTSLNPLVSNVIRSDKLASSMTFGQFVKAIASFLAPVIAAWGVSHPVFGLSWRILFPIYTIVGVIATLWAFCNAYRGGECRGTRFQFQGVLLSARKPFILLCFIGIICHVGIDVGINVTAPKVMVERLGVTLSVALQATMVYFICSYHRQFPRYFHPAISACKDVLCNQPRAHRRCFDRPDGIFYRGSVACMHRYYRFRQFQYLLDDFLGGAS
jgi:fucose permease